jgi:hypothetical protein
MSRLCNEVTKPSRSDLKHIKVIGMGDDHFVLRRVIHPFNVALPVPPHPKLARGNEPHDRAIYSPPHGQWKT